MEFMPRLEQADFVIEPGDHGFLVSALLFLAIPKDA